MSGAARGAPGHWVARWPARTQMVLALPSFVLIAWAQRATGAGDVGPYLAALPLIFLVVGFTQPQGTSLLLAPVAAIALAFGVHGGDELVTVLGVVLPISVLAGERVALSEARHRRTEEQVDRLLHASRVLSHIEDERSGAHLVAALSVEMLHAQGAAVLLNAGTRPHRYLNRAFRGHPSLAEAAPLLLDLLPGAASGPITFHPRRDAGDRVRAALTVPLFGAARDPIGVIVVMWQGRKRSLACDERRAAELLSEEAGRMFERVRTTASLARAADTDPLTELANRRTFARALETLRADDAVIVVDLDHFKQVNDRYGHQVGDETLRALARCLRATARQVDTVARYGGEEFAVILPGAGTAGADVVLRRVRHAWNLDERLTTFSAGVAVHDGTEDAASTLRRADAALYSAKAAGRDRDVFAPGSEMLLP